MKSKTNKLAVLGSLLLLSISGAAMAVQPEVKTVPWVATNPLIPHDTWSGKSISLKGTANVQGANFTYSWDFGDGSPTSDGIVSNQYNIGVSHTYTGSAGDIFTARLTVEDTNTGESDSEIYLVQIQAQSLDVEVNVAIDEGLWYLHRTMRRFDLAGPPAQQAGDWDQGTSCGSFCASSTWHAVTPANVTAFFVNGHLETGAVTNPYTETVQRAMKMVFENLQVSTIPTSQTNGLGTFNPDANGNTQGIEINQSDDFYQGGTFIDAIVASGTPAALATTGPAAGRTYADIVQDMVDFYSYCQYDTTGGGGWRYSCNQFPDGSAAQWAAIGMIAAERQFGAIIPQIVKDWNRVWIDTSHNETTGVAGYTSTSPIWGPYATTPSAMVQMVMDGIGRGDATGWWDISETYLRNNFANAGTSYSNNIKNYYYGLFSFTKSMLLHDANGDGIAEPLSLLQSSTAGVTPIDWYSAQVSQGDPTDGVARTLVDDQHPSGYWYAHNASSTQYPFETAWAIIMLNRTVFASGVPVAVAQALPNPAVAGQVIVLDGSTSFSQDPSKSIDSWEWDLDNDGAFDDATGPTTTISFPVVGDYPIGLRVTDNGSPELHDDAIIIVKVSTPPLAPTADPDGPYVFCPQSQPWFLDGTGSVNPDEGLSEPGQPGDTIQTYAWDLDGDNVYDDAIGAQPDVTAFFTALGIGDYLIKLKVTDTTATSFPSSTLGDLSDTASTQVSVKDAADPACACIDDLVARAKSGKVQLVWTATGDDHYNVYRSTVAGGPYALIASTTSTYSTYLDTGLVDGTTYYYVVRPAALNGNELCQSNEASATPTARVRSR